MGLTGTPSTLVAPRSRGVIDPKTGRPIGEDTALFAGMTDELADRASWLPRPTISSTGPEPVR